MDNDENSAVKRDQIIFTLDIINADKNQEWASRLLLIATRAKYRNNRPANQRGRKTTYKLSNIYNNNFFENVSNRQR